MVYVDGMYRSAMGQYRGMKMSHMLADSPAELLAMADTIGVDRKWLQKAGTPTEHFDIALSKRRLAVKAGAREITRAELAALLRKKRQASQTGLK